MQNTRMCLPRRPRPRGVATPLFSPVAFPHSWRRSRPTKVTSIGPLPRPPAAASSPPPSPATASVTFRTSPLRGYAIRPHEFQNNAPVRRLRNTREHLRARAKPTVRSDDTKTRVSLCARTCVYASRRCSVGCNFPENQTRETRKIRRLRPSAESKLSFGGRDSVAARARARLKRTRG